VRVQARELFDGAAAALADRAAGLDARSWGRATPCEDWDVRQLLQHIVEELRWIPPLLDGATVAEVGDRLTGDLLGDDPAGAAVAAVRDAVAAAGVVDPERAVHLSRGDQPARTYLAEVGLDVLVHTWDLARATGQPDPGPDELAVAASEGFAADDEAMWREYGALAAAVTPSADASAMERLVARLGRDPGWTAP
jgi:uncharacterized protein (TIGR03086 family)